MMGTIHCIYETPCHWCSKWDKKCDCKIGVQSKYQNEPTNCKHEWEATNSGGAYTDLDGKSRVYTTYCCKLCGMTKDM